MKKKLIFSIILTLAIIFPLSLQAQESTPQDEIFQARVLEVLKEEKTILENGGELVKQHLKLEGISGSFNGEDFEFNGLGNIEVLDQKVFQAGDKVLVAASYDILSGEPNFYIVDSVRTGKLWLLAGLFLTVLLLVGRFKGFRSLVALALTFVIIIKFIIPQILAGANPLMITISGSLVILIIIIYVTEGFNPRAHLSAVSIFLSLFLTAILSWLFVSLTKLSGAASEEVLFLFNMEGAVINLQGLLLAGIIIGALGVLDDVVISQVATVEELARANSSFTAGQLFKKAYRVGTSHIASMTNTLFLAYAGASLPLLILFVSGQSAFGSWGQALNTELISTEIVRALAGSIGLILSVPLATGIAAWYFAKKK